VIGIEMNAAAVSDAHKNAENNGIKNCRFICSKVRSAVLIFQILVESILYLASHIHYGFFRSWEKFQFALFFFPCIKNCNFCMLAYMRKQAEQVMGSLLKEYLDVPKEQADDSDVPEDNACPDPGNGESASHHSENNNSEIENDVPKGSTSENGNTSRKQFKNVVAIVDPPRAGLHPTVRITL
jgi:tRNA (uracil-5-)-methyltransferase